MTSRDFRAFPLVEHGGACSVNEGMTLRDYFAAKAMQAFLRESDTQDGAWHIEATASYEVADAMLAARDK